MLSELVLGLHDSQLRKYRRGFHGGPWSPTKTEMRFMFCDPCLKASILSKGMFFDLERGREVELQVWLEKTEER